MGELGIPSAFCPEVRALASYVSPLGREWSDHEIDDATGEVMTCSCISNLRNRRMRDSGYERLRTTTKAMGFPLKLWFGDSSNSLEDIRTGTGANPAVPRLIAVADVFGSCFIDREAMETLREETVGAIAHKNFRLPAREKHKILSIIWQLEYMSGTDDDN